MSPVLAVLAFAAHSSATTLPSSDRVSEARALKLAGLERVAKAHHLEYPFRDVFLRAFKKEKLMEVWVSDKTHYPLTHVLTYGIAAASGGLGPKLIEGDGQVPEGYYDLDRFNPVSQFLLSMRVAYPNASDRIRSGRRRPGADIYIHGNQVSAGCLAMTDDVIRELYLLCYDSYKAHRQRPHILILPFRSGIPSREWPSEDTALWTQLYAINRRFDKTRTMPKVTIDPSGAYVIPPLQRAK